jgi:hypothetical protein
MPAIDLEDFSSHLKDLGQKPSTVVDNVRYLRRFFGLLQIDGATGFSDNLLGAILES